MLFSQRLVKKAAITKLSEAAFRFSGACSKAKNCVWTVSYQTFFYRHSKTPIPTKMKCPRKKTRILAPWLLFGSKNDAGSLFCYLQKVQWDWMNGALFATTSKTLEVKKCWRLSSRSSESWFTAINCCGLRSFYPKSDSELYCSPLPMYLSRSTQRTEMLVSPHDLKYRLQIVVCDVLSLTGSFLVFIAK